MSHRFLKMFGFVYFVTILLSQSILQSNAEICFSEYCEHHMTISFGTTMTKMDNGRSEGDLMVKNDCLHESSVTPTRRNCLKAKEIPTLDKSRGQLYPARDQLVTVDGHKRKIILVNGQFPGPTIEVGHNSKVVVHVHNGLGTTATSIHWHGVTMKDTPWMDGVAYLTQCPILPHQTFTYNFKATTPGTHWYHSHLGNQRRDGLYGLFIVHERKPMMPAFPLIVQDWFHDEGFTEKSPDVRMYSPKERPKPVTSLINGRNGLPKSESIGLGLKDMVPTFRVDQGADYRFHVLNPGVRLSYEVHIDQHQISVEALDGRPIVPITVTSFIINTGERVDFVLKANQPAGRYWLRAKPVEIQPGEMGYTNEEEMEENENTSAFKVKAIILYGDVDYALPNSTHECTQGRPCKRLNCPFPPPPFDHKAFIPVASVQSKNLLSKELGKETRVTEVFLNVAMNWQASINARRHIEPLSPLYPTPEGSGIVDCNKVCFNDEKGCECTHLQELPYNETIQIIFTNFQPPSTGLHTGHPMHIHGYHFAVVAQGFPSFNESSGLKTADNADIKCNDPLCKDMFWAKRPDKMNLVDPPMKDTVIVPPGGYVVVRFRSDNPGYWSVHCHILADMMDGMGMIFKIAPEKAPAPPKGFPTCTPFQQSLISIISQKTEDPNDLTDDQALDAGMSDAQSEPRAEEEDSDLERKSKILVESNGKGKALVDTDYIEHTWSSQMDELRTLKEERHIGMMVGVTLGGVVLGALLVAFALMCLRWNQASERKHSYPETEPRKI